MSFISSKASIGRSLIGSTAIIIGPSIIGDDTIIDNDVIIGYPCRRSIRNVIKKYRPSNYLELLDIASTGCRIGKLCHIRSGTIIYESVVIGDEVETGHNVLIRENTIIGNRTIVGTSSIIEGNVKIGNNVRIESGVFIPIGTVIGDNVFLGPYVVITNDKYPPSKKLVGVVIEDNVVIGANSTLLAGIRIGRGAIVAAGAVVTKDVPPNTIVAGIPARPIGNRDSYEKKRKIWESSSK